MSNISPIGAGASGIKPIEFPSIGETQGPEQAGGGFGDKLSGAIGDLQKTQATSDDMAMKVATGELTDIHDYMIAANQAQVATQLTVAVKNKAVESFQQIMNMQV